MKSSRTLVWLVVVLVAACFVPTAHAALGVCDTAGPIEVESTGGTTTPTLYTTLGGPSGAFAAINAGTHTGVINIEVCGDSTETATATLNGSGSGSASYTSLTMKPVGGVRTISGSLAAALVSFNGADNVTVDGVNDGLVALTISNTSTASTSGTCTLQFAADATSNTITRTTLLGSSTTGLTSNGGTVYFGAGAVSTGNDNNTISNCNIGPAVATLPTKALDFNGTTTSTALNNSGIVITGNNVYDYFAAAATSAGIYINGGTTDCTFSNNKFYQTATRTQTTGAQHSAVWISNTSGNNFQVTGNTIGYASSAGTGNYTFAGVASSSFVPVFLSVGTTTATSVQGNTITAIAMSGALSGTTTGAPLRAIYVSGGLVNVGTVTGNTFGSLSATGAITFTSSSTSASDVVFYANNGSNASVVNNSSIGGITLSNSSTGAVGFYGMYANTSNSSTASYVNNTIGGTVANSINNTATATASFVYGIRNNSSSFAPALTATGNIIRNMTLAAGNTGTGSTASVIGIIHNHATPTPNNISQNQIYALTNTHPTAATAVTGIFYGGTTGANVVARNTVHSLSVATTSTSAVVTGIQTNGGTTVYQNNMVRLGFDAAGIAQVVGHAIYGINDAIGTNNYYFNSVYVGGTGVGGASNTFAFNSTVTTNTRLFENNVFFNARSNGTGTGKHYAVRVGGTTVNPTGLTINYNVYYVTGVGGVFGLFNGADVASLSAWRTAVGQDASSIYGDPKFTLADGSAATGDLHIDPLATTPVEGNGLLIASVTDDFDGQLRSGLTPTDMGADAGNFLGVDLTPPSISYSALGNTTATTNRTLAITVTDLTGVPTAGIGLPTLYFRKSTDPWASNPCSNVSGSSYTCTFDYALIGGVVLGDTLSYYVAAQDTASPPNVTTNPSAGASGFNANPPAASTPPTTPNSYRIVTAFSGTKSVCASGCDYVSLTNAGGAFEALNLGVLTGNTALEIAGDLTAEAGTNALNALTEEPVGSNFSVRIYPVGAPRSVTSTTAPTGGFLRLNAADRVTLDGSLSGTGTDRSLTVTLAATGTSTAVVWLQNNGTDGATLNTIKNLNVVGNSNTTTLIGIGMGGTTVGTSSLGTNNNSNTIQNNAISKVQFGIYSQGASAAVKNTGNVISQNVMNAASPANVAKGGIQLGFEDGVVVTQNTIDGVTQGGSPDVFGIALGLTSVTTSSISGNEVTNGTVTRNFIGKVTNTGTFSAMGISVAPATSGTTTIANNSIYGVGANGTSGDFGSAILLGGGTGSTTRVYYNSVSITGALTSGSYPNYGLAIAGSDPVVDVRDNVFYNTLTNGTGVSFAIGTASTTFANLTSNFNDHFVTAGGGTFKIGKTGSLSQGSGTEYTLLADWQAATGKDANSISSNPLFNSGTNLEPQNGSPLIAAGTPIASVTTDIKNTARSETAPSIGAYEQASDTNPPVITYSPLSNTPSTTDPTLSVTVTDASGVPTSGIGLPQVYFRKGVSGAFAASQCTFVSGSAYDCVITYASVGGVVAGDVVQYYVAAQDAAAIPNVTVNPLAGAGAFTANPPAAGTPPTTPNSYTIQGYVSGTKTVCDTGCDFASLTNAGGAFSWVNGNIVAANLVFEIAGDLTAETGAVALNQWSETGAGGYTVSIHPTGAARIVSGNNAVGLVKLNGADRVTIDGSLSGGTDRSLSFTNTNAATSATVLWIASAAAGNGANDVTIKNCVIYGTGSTTLIGITSGSGTTLGGAGEAPNSNVVIHNNDIYAAQNAIYQSGNAAFDQGWQITNNSFGSSVAANRLGFRGLILQNAQNAIISGNTIRGVYSSSSSTSAAYGIQIGTGASAMTIAGNTISDIRQTNTSGYAARGIYVNTSLAASNITVVNNAISDIASYSDTTTSFAFSPVGIMIDGTTGGVNVYFNSVELFGSHPGLSSATLQADLYVGSSATALDVRDNIFVNGYDNSTSTTERSYAVYSMAAASAFTAIDYNDYFVSGSAGVLGFIGGSEKATLTAWQTATGKDAHSLAADPLFASTSDLHVTVGSPAIAAATPIAGVTTDIVGNLRNATTPTMGAYEFGCTSNADCTDNNVCTDDACVLGLCQHTANTSSCDDGNGCTLVDVCSAGACTGTTPKDCSDSDACTTDSCTASTGECTHAAVTCNDGNACTDDACNAVTGCVYTANDANTCSDGSLCTTDDHCSAGTCTGTQPNCDDGNVCTNDSCNPTSGACVHANAANACSDENACTSGDTCGDAAVFTEHFDGVTAPALPAGWATANTVGLATDVFKTVTTSADTAPNAAYAADTDSASDKSLTTPSFVVTTAAKKLHFMHKVDLERSTSTSSIYDGAVLEISINGGAFTDFVTAGGLFESGGYDGPITATSNPLYPRNCWTGTTTGFVAVKAAFPAAAVGQSVQLRWRVGTDLSVGHTGYWLDSVNVAEELYACQPGAPVVCNDANACTTDSCDTKTGCAYVPVVVDDSNPCTVDSCDAGSGVAHVPGNAGTLCRGAAGVCDTAEVCDGVDANCPADAKSTAECRAPAGLCDVAEACDGVGNDCPADVIRPSGFTCRAGAGDCDVAELCDGSSTACPADAFQPATTECRPSAGQCDVADFCSGAAATCGADVKSTAECRPATGVCDLAESCDGATNDCPADQGLPLNYTYYADNDADTYGNPATGQADCRATAPAGRTADNTDCNDASAAVHPGATEVPGDGIDENCDGNELCYTDADHDAYGTTATVPSTNLACSTPGEAAVGTDCDDANASIHPGAVEHCDGVDEDCDGLLNGGQANADCQEKPADWTCTTNTCSATGVCTLSGVTCSVSGHVFYYRDSTDPDSDGTLEDSSTKGVPNVTLDLTGDATGSASSAADGSYSVPAGGAYTLTLADLRGQFTKPADGTVTYQDGVSSLDATYASKSVVALKTLSPRQRLAADVSGNGRVTSFDASLIAQKAVGLIARFPVATLGGFDSDWVLSPRLAVGTVPSASVSDVDFVGVLYGDVTGNWGEPAASFAGGAENDANLVVDAPVLTRPAVAGAGARNLGAGSDGGTIRIGGGAVRQATLYIAAAPTRNDDGTWTVVLGLSNADGILGLDLGLSMDPQYGRITGIRTTGIASDMHAQSNDLAGTRAVSLFGVTPMAGTGEFLVVTFATSGSTVGPLTVSAEANEGQIPLVIDNALRVMGSQQ